MSGVNKEAPVVEDTKDLAKEDAKEEQQQQPPTESSTATPTTVDPATTTEAIKDAASSAANTVSDKATKIFGSFTSGFPTTTTKEGEETRKPLFGAFTGSGSAWATAPTTAGGFGATSALTPKKDEEKEEEVHHIFFYMGKTNNTREKKLPKVLKCISNP